MQTSFVVRALLDTTGSTTVSPLSDVVAVVVNLRSAPGLSAGTLLLCAGGVARAEVGEGKDTGLVRFWWVWKLKEKNGFQRDFQVQVLNSFSPTSGGGKEPVMEVMVIQVSALKRSY